MENTNDQFHQINAFIQGFLILIIGYVAFVWIMALLIPPEVSEGFLKALFIGTAVWTCIFFFGGISNRWYKKTPTRHVQIVANALKKVTVRSGGAIQTSDREVSLRILYPGWNFLYLSEYPVEGGLISTEIRSFDHEDESTDSFQTEDIDNSVTLAYKFFWKPLAGYEINFFRFRHLGLKDEDLADELRGLLRGFLEQYCRTETQDALITSVRKINDAVDKQFLRNPELKELEKNFGMQIIKGSVFQAKLPESVKKIRADLQKGEVFAKTAARLKEKYPDLTDEQTLNYAGIIEGKEGITIERRDINEIFEARGLPSGLLYFNKGGGEGKPGGKGDKKGEDKSKKSK